jgi:hypothetical protein
MRKIVSCVLYGEGRRSAQPKLHGVESFDQDHGPIALGTAYSFQCLFEFTSKKLKVAPSALMLEQLDAPLVCSFLEHLETTRGNSAETRNVRLAAIRGMNRKCVGWRRAGGPDTRGGMPPCAVRARSLAPSLYKLFRDDGDVEVMEVAGEILDRHEVCPYGIL